MLAMAGRILAWLIGAAIGIAFGSWMLLQVMTIGIFGGIAEATILCLALLPIYALVIAIHELGHLVVGLTYGMQVSQFNVMLVRFERRDERLRLGVNWDWNWYLPQGDVRAEIANPGNRRQWAQMIAGGPIASILFGALCLGLAAWIHPGAPDALPRNACDGWRSLAILMPGDLATAAFNIAGVLSLVLGIGSLMPCQIAGFRSDGGQLLDLIGRAW